MIRETPKLKMYVPDRDEDLRLILWWRKMERDGDLEMLFVPDSRKPSDLLDMMKPPKVLLYALDADGDIWFAMWGDQLMSGVFLGAWLAKERRQSRSGLEALLLGWEYFLTHVPVVLGVTKQERLLKEHAKLGYTVLGKVPAFF